MHSSDITPEQAERLKAIVARKLRFLNRLQERMNRLTFPTDDPLWLSVVYARNAAQDLFVACHYAGCKSGVGRRAKPSAAANIRSADGDQEETPDQFSPSPL